MENRDQRLNNDKFSFTPMMLQNMNIHLPDEFFDPLDIHRVDQCRDKTAIKGLLRQYEIETGPKSAVFIAMNDNHAMVLIVPYDCFQNIHLVCYYLKIFAYL